MTRGRFLAFVVVALLVVAGVVVVDLSRPAGRPESPPGAWTLVPHTGLGAWVDAYDWTIELGGPTPAVGIEEIDAMADAGVQTVYLQTSHRRSTSDVMEPAQLDLLIDRAHLHRMHVVGWYLPTYVDLEEDLDRFLAAAELPIDGLAVDIESTDVVDVADRNARVVELTDRLRDILGTERTLAAITLSTVHTQVVNPEFWPDYPYAQIGARYDVVMPMAYWTLRTGDYRLAHTYVGENIDRLRAQIGPTVPVHVIGGIGDEASTADMAGFRDTAHARDVIGASLYDWATSNEEQWEELFDLRGLRSATAGS